MSVHVGQSLCYPQVEKPVQTRVALHPLILLSFRDIETRIAKGVRIEEVNPLLDIIKVGGSVLLHVQVLLFIL